MKASEYANKLFYNTEVLEKEADWNAIELIDNFRKIYLKTLWDSRVPYSNAPESLAAAAVQSYKNQGYIVSNLDRLFTKGLEALKQDDLKELELITTLLFSKKYLRKNRSDNYWNFSRPVSYSEVSQGFPKINFQEIRSRKTIHGGLIGSIIGGAYGTPIEGYTYWSLEKAYHNFNYYLRPINTINDDICFQIILLLTYHKKREKITSKDIAYGWLKYLPFAWSAELIALENLRRGLLPPQTATLNNPFGEWIGAAMRGTMPGLISFGNPYKAAKLAFLDASISHYYNGIYGEIFIAVLTSLAHKIKNIHELINLSINFIPKNSELEFVVKETINQIELLNNFHKLRDFVYLRFQNYNWIHLYPNIAIILIALSLGEGNFLKTMELIGKSGFDVDCNAGIALGILGVQNPQEVPQNLISPIGNTFQTYLRDYKEVNLNDLIELIYKL